MKMIHATAAWHTTINLYYQENRAKCYRPVAKCNGNKCRWSRIWKADMWELCRSWDCFPSLLCSSLHCAPSATWTVIMLAGTGPFSSTSYLLLSYIKKAMADWAQSTSRVRMGNIRWSCSSNPLCTWWMLSDLAACWIVDWHSKLKSPVLLAYHAGCSPSCLQWNSFLLVVSILSWKRHFFLWTGRMRSNNRDDLIIHSFLLLRMLNSLEEEQLLVQCTGLPDPWCQFWKYQENREGEKRQHWCACVFCWMALCWPAGMLLHVTIRRGQIRLFIAVVYLENSAVDVLVWIICQEEFTVLFLTASALWMRCSPM